MITASFTTRLAEQVAATRIILFKTWSHWLMFGLFVLLPLLTLAVTDRHPGDGWAAWTIVGVSAFGLVVWWFFPWYIIWIVRRGVSHPDGPYEMTLGEESIRLASPAVTAEWKWDAVRRARETSFFFLLYVARSQAQFIPKRVLGPEQAARIRVLVLQKLGSRAELARQG